MISFLRSLVNTVVYACLMAVWAITIHNGLMELPLSWHGGWLKIVIGVTCLMVSSAVYIKDRK